MVLRYAFLTLIRNQVVLPMSAIFMSGNSVLGVISGFLAWDEDIILYLGTTTCITTVRNAFLTQEYFPWHHSWYFLCTHSCLRTVPLNSTKEGIIYWSTTSCSPYQFMDTEMIPDKLFRCSEVNDTPHDRGQR